MPTPLTTSLGITAAGALDAPPGSISLTDPAFSGALAPQVIAAAPVNGVLTLAFNGGGIINVPMLTANLTVNAPTGTFADGDTLTFRFAQDATGGRVITWNAAFVFPIATPASSLPTGPVNKYEVAFGYHAADGTWRARGVAGPY